ncbi:MAG: oligosaccharide flippase family protein, partial [Planctomycetota bacterium]
MASIARNTFYLTVAKALNTAIYAVFGLFLPRFVPAEQVGVYGLMTTLIFFGSFAASFGIPLVLVRALAKDKAEIRALFVDARASMMAAALLAGLAILGYMLLEMSFQEQMDVRRALLAFLVGGILLGDAIGAVGESIYQAHEEMELPALVEAGAGAFRAAFSVLALMVLPEPSRLFGVFGIFLIGSAGRGFLLAKLAQRRFLPGPLPPPSSRRSFRLLRESL